ncbi:MAG: DEAD/DEAH box helicase [Desulfobulbaceae bacterium]|jgi:superfamily II DNA or RNA helicase|nr:DEAD/DEAH box helicase [Desulfobulbaceae bacterium]MDY0351395.1 DEAD/DEAH box helicase [Desulfobulbaceae bacterium]
MNKAETAQTGGTGAIFRLTVDSEACLEGAGETLKAIIRQKLTIINPKYQAAKRYSRWIGKKLKPTLYFFHDRDGRLVFPRGFVNQAITLSRQVTGAVPEIIDNRRRLPPADFAFHGSLRPYQQQAVDAVLGHSFGVLEAGTGSGKTIMALNILAARQQPTLIIVHTKELLHQWRERIGEFLHLEAGQAGDGRYDIRPVTVAIVNTARRNLADLPSEFGQIIVDECHRVPASLFTDVVCSFDSYFMLGLSATAFRREDGMTQLIYTYMGDRLHAVNQRVLAESGAVVRPELIQRPTGFKYGFHGDYAKLIKALAADEDRNDLIAGDIAAIVRAGHEGTVLVVSDRVAHCEILQRKLARQGFDSVLLTGRVAAEQRAAIVDDVRQGRVRVLISTLQLIGEGFDCPGLNTLVLSTPIKFEGRLLQVVGRIMRPAGSKKAQVIDYVDAHVPVLRRSGGARRMVFDRW